MQVALACSVLTDAESCLFDDTFSFVLQVRRMDITEDISSNLPLHLVSPLSTSLIDVIQRIAAHWNPRGLSRFVWLSRRLMFGTGMRVVRYQKRFRVICECDSHYSLMTVAGFNHRAMDRLLSTLIQDTAGDVTFVDVGANIGFVSLLACSAAKGGQKVYAHCFEPDPRAFKWLVLNSSLNSYQMILKDWALGAAQGRAQLTLGTMPSSSTLVPDGLSYVSNVGRKKVEVTTLDTYCTDQTIAPDIVKVDVEGYEPYVLQGASQVLEQARPYLIVEINSKALVAGGHSAAELLEMLASLGYSLFLVNHRQVGLFRNEILRRGDWHGYREVYPRDAASECLFDVLGVPRARVLA